MDSSSLIVVTIVAIILYTVGGRLYRFYLFRKRVNKIPGPTYAIPFFGIVFETITKPREDRLEWFRVMSDQFKDGFCRTWLASTPTVHIHKPEHIEVILGSTKQIVKGLPYEYLQPWLGGGLITSTGAQWFHNRKLLTPTFHSGILEHFADVMIDKAVILNGCIKREIEIYGDKPFNIFELCGKCTLDIICETAMGTNLAAQDGVENEYIRAINAITTGALNRFFQPWLRPDWIFYRTAFGKSFKAAVDTAQDFCIRVIEKKQKKRKLGGEMSHLSTENDVMGKQKRRAFLDLLLEANEKEDDPLTMDEIRDQTNTFMFAGHDTTAALLNWAIFCLGNELDVQRKVQEELDDMLGDSDDLINLKKLSNLQYLERVIKEVLRLYPSVASVSRTTVEDVQIGDYVVPEDVILNIQIYRLHRDPAVWPDPLRFDPDRFLPENVKTRHPYAYVPFSAGPRNCIGKKFAMLEAKILLTQILRNFSIKSVESLSTMKMYGDIILRPVNGIYVTMTKRAIGVKKRK